jgi:hypothetical protein
MRLITGLAIGWLLGRRARRPRHEAHGDRHSDEAAILEMLIQHARPLLEAQLQDGDELATKALGALAVNVSALAVVVSVRGDLNESWWLAGAGLLMSSVLLLATIWPRRFSVGPDPAEFYEEMGAASHLVAARQMLAEFIAALDRNDAPLRTKNRLFKTGFALLVASGFVIIGVVLAS